MMIFLGVLTLGHMTTFFEFWSMLLDTIDLDLYLDLELNKRRINLNRIVVLK